MHVRKALGLFVAVLPSLAWAGITISPMLVEKTVTPEDNEIELTIANGNDTPIEVQLSVSPMQHTQAGEAVEGSASYAYDISKLIEVPKETIVVKPRRWKRVRAKVTVPAGRTGGGYAFIHAKTLPQASADAQLLAAFDFRVIVEVTFRQSAVKNVKIADVRSDAGALKVAIRNDGDTHVRPAGTVELKDASGKVVFTSPLASENVFPALVRDLKLAQAPPPDLTGRFTAVVKVSAPTPAETQRTVAADNGRLVVTASASP